MRLFPRNQRRFTLGFKAMGVLANLVFLYSLLLPSGRLAAQEYRQFKESAEKMEGFNDRANRLENQSDWENYMNLGVASERAQWEQEAFEKLQERVGEIEESDLEDAEKENEINRAKTELEAAANAWQQDAEEFKQTKRGEYRAEQADIQVSEVDEALFLDLIARAEAAVAGQAAVDLDGWEAAIQVPRDAIVQDFEAELTGELDRARSENAGLSGAELAAFEAELADIESDIRREFDVRESFYVTRARNRYVALKRGDDLNARLASEEASATSVTESVIENTLATLETETSDMLETALTETEDLVATPDNPDFEAAGTNWEARMESVISAGLRSWEVAEEDLYARRLSWQQETKRSREEGQRVWEASHEELKTARDQWLSDIQVQIKEGREQWQSKIAEFRENKAAAEQEMTEYIAKERERWDASSKELASIVNGGGGALLETKDAYRYYDDLIKAMPNPGGGNERDRAIYDFYVRQRGYMQGAVQRFQGILGSAEGVLSANMHSGEDHTGLLNDVRVFAGDLPDRLKALDAADYETQLRTEMAGRSEDFVLYRRDLEDLVDRNAVFTERAAGMVGSSDFDYNGAADLQALADLVGGLERKYDDHKVELSAIFNEPREGLTDDERLAAIKTDITAWLAASTEKDERLKKETTAYFNAGLGGYYLTGNEGDPYLMTRAEYEWELLRRERDYLTKKLRRAEAVKDYADRAFQHDAGLEMAAVTAERAAIARTHRDLREIAYQLIRGEIELDPLVYKVSPGGQAMADTELARILAERGIDQAALNGREATINTELAVLDTMLGHSPAADGAEVTDLIARIDTYLESQIPDVEARKEHALGIVREKLISYRDRLNAGASADEQNNSWTAIKGGANVLREETQALKDDYNFTGLTDQITTVRNLIVQPNLTMIRGDLAQMKSEIEANEKLLADAKERLDLAKDAYRQARIDYDIMRANNSEDLIRIDLTNTTGSLGRVIHQMTKLENVDGFNAVYDPLTAGRVEYLNEVSQREIAQADLNGSEEALMLVRFLDESKKRLANLEGILSANTDLASKTPEALADLFIDKKDELITSGSTDPTMNSGQQSTQAMQNLEQLRAALDQTRQNLTDAQGTGDASKIEIARAGLLQIESAVRRNTELLVSAMRGEERSRRESFLFYLDSRDGNGDPLADPESVAEDARADDEELSARVFDLSKKSAERIASFLAANARDGGGNPNSFANLLKLANDQLAGLADPVRLSDGYGYDDAAVASMSERIEWDQLRNWLVENRAAIDAAGTAPDANDRRTIDEKIDALIQSTTALAADAAIYDEFQATIPGSATHTWVNDYRTDRETLLGELEGVIGASDAGLAAAFNALPAERRALIEGYGAINATYLRDSLQAAAAALRRDLAELDVNFAAVYRREARAANMQRIEEIAAELSPIQNDINNALIEKTQHQNERERLNTILSNETDPAEQTRLTSDIADLDARIVVLTDRIDSLKPRAETLTAEYRREAALASEASQPGSSSQFAKKIMGSLALESQNVSILEQTAQAMAPEAQNRAVKAEQLSAQDQMKAVLGFYQTDANGQILRDGSGNPLVSQEFIDLGVSDPATDLGSVLAGDQSGNNLMRWAERLAGFVADDAKRATLTPEVLAAMDMLEDGIREVLAAQAFIDNRYETKGSLQTSANERQRTAQESLKKMGLVLDLQASLEQTIQEAAQKGDDPAAAALALLEKPENARLLRMYAGYDQNGEPDGAVDPEAQARLDELIQLARRLRDNRVAAHLTEVRTSYASMLGDYVNFARGEPLALAPDRVDFLNAHPELQLSATRAAIDALPGDTLPDDETFRAGLWKWTETAPVDARFYRGKVIEILTASSYEGQQLKDEVLAALDTMDAEIQASLDSTFTEIERKAHRDANLTVQTSVANLIASYANRGTTTRNAVLPVVTAIADAADVVDARADVRTALNDLATLDNNEAAAATLELRREILELISTAADTAQLKSNLATYLNNLTDPAQAELDQLQQEVGTRSFLEATAIMDASPTYVAAEYPEALRDFLLTSSYQKAAKRYDDYQTARASTLESTRESAQLNLSGLNGEIAGHFLLQDFAAYRAANDPTAAIAAADPERGLTLNEYLGEYLQSRNATTEMLPAGGAAIVEQTAHAEYGRLQADIAANGIASINENAYFGEFREYIRIQKAKDYIDRNGIVLSGATALDRASELNDHLNAFLSDASYTIAGKTMGQNMLLRAERDSLFNEVFGLLEYNPPLTAYLPTMLDGVQAAGQLDDPPRGASDFLPDDLTAIIDYATIDPRGLLSNAGDEAAAVHARTEVMQAASEDESFAAKRLTDSELAAIADRAGYASATAELRAELIQFLRGQNTAVRAGGAQSASQAINVLRQQKALEKLLPNKTDQENLATFLAGENTRLSRIETKFFTALADRHADLQQATKEERGNILAAVIERAGGNNTAYYNALSADLKTELDALQTELFGSGTKALSADEQNALTTQKQNYELAFQLRGDQQLLSSGLFEALEGEALTALGRQDNDALRTAAAADRPALLRALIDSFYVENGDRASVSAASRAYLDANAGLEALLTRAASELPDQLADHLKNESVLVDRFLADFQEDAAERQELEAIFTDPAVANPDARLAMGYEAAKEKALLASDSQELTGALASTITNHREFFQSLTQTFEREIAVTTELQKFSATLRPGADYMEGRYASFRTFVGTERKYQDSDLSDEEKYGGVLHATSLGENDPEGLLNRADWADVLKSDTNGIVKEVTDDQGNTVRLRAVYTVSDPAARNKGGNYEAEMRHTYFEHIANNYLDKISKLNGALNAVFAATQFADKRTTGTGTDYKQALRDNYDVNATTNDLKFLEDKKIDAQSRLAVHSQDKIRGLQNSITGLSKSYDSAADEFAQAARRDQISTMPLEGFLKKTFEGIATEMNAAEGAHTALSNEAERLRNNFDNKNRELADTLSHMAENWRQYSSANDEYEERAQVEEYAQTPYLFASAADSEGDETSTLIEEYRGDALEEYDLARRAVDYVDAQLKEAAYAVYTQDELPEFHAIVAGIEAGQTYAALTADDTKRLLELRDRKHRDYETLTAAEETELTELNRREMYSRYKDVIETRAEHIKHAMRMVRVHKANELIRDEVMRRRAVADEKEKQFKQTLGTEFGSFEGDDQATEARNGVYARLAGMVEGGASNIFNEFRNWYWGGNNWADDAFNSYVGASQSALKLVQAPKFWPTQITEGILGLAGASMTNARDRNAIGLWMGAGGSIAEWGMFKGIYYGAITAMGVRDQMKLKYEITYAIWSPHLTPTNGLSLLMYRTARTKIDVATIEKDVAQQNMWLLYGLAASTASTGSIRRVMGVQREYEDALAALYYFTRIPDQTTLKQRMIGYGAAQSDDPNDNSGAALYKLTEEDLVYLFDRNDAGDAQYLNSNGGDNNPSAEIKNESLDITGLRDQVEYRDTFGRRYDPKTIQDGVPGKLQAGYYWNGDEPWTRLRFFSHDGSTRYRYAKIIDEDADLHTVYNMEDVLKAAVPHGQDIRNDRFKKYNDAGNAVAQSLQDQTLILNERDNTYENLFNQAAGNVEGGREFTGYQNTYDDYRKNADQVFQNELTQRENVQLKEWELREKELVDRYNEWEKRVATILDRGAKSWAGSEDRFLQRWRQWERDFEAKVDEGEKKWDEEVAAHFTKKQEWETETRAKATEATIEKVLGEQIDTLNRQLRASSSVLKDKMGTINRTAMINDAIQQMRRELPSGGAKLKSINKNIKNFSTAISTAELVKGNFQNTANSLANSFRKEMKTHQKNMKVLANVKIFEQYRQMIVQFKKTITVQNRQIANQTAAAAMAQGYIKMGDTFVKKGASSSAMGFVNAYKWFDVDTAMDKKLREFGFEPMDGNSLTAFLDNKSNVEVEAYFYTQKLAVSAAIEEIQGRGSEQERKTSRDASVIGEFSAWVGSASGDDPFHGHAETLAGNSFGGENLEARGWAMDLMQAGYGELGAMGTRPGGAPAGFYVQLKHMSKHVAQSDAAGVAKAGEVDPITNTINGFNPLVALSQSIENVEVGSRVYGRDRGKLVGAQVLNVGKQALIAGGQIVMTAGNFIAPGVAVAVGAAMIAAGNAIQVNPTTGESSFKMTDQAAISSLTSIAGGLIPGLGPVASAAMQATISIANAGMEYDENGQSQGWKMNSEKLREKGAGMLVSAVGAGLGAELGGAMGGGMMATAVGNAVGSSLANNVYQHSKGNRALMTDAGTIAANLGGIANSYMGMRESAKKALKKDPNYKFTSVGTDYGVGGRFAAGAIGSIAGSVSPFAKLGFAAYEKIAGRNDILARAPAEDNSSEKKNADTANKGDQNNRLKSIQDSYALRKKNRGLFSRLVVHGAGALGMDSDRVGNWMDGDSYASTSDLISLDYSVSMMDNMEIRNKAGAASSLLDRARSQNLSIAERQAAMKQFTETAEIHNSNSAATKILTELQLRGADTRDWEGIVKKLGGRGKNVSQNDIQKILDELGPRLGADMNMQIDQKDFNNLYSKHVAAGNQYDANWRALTKKKYSPAQIRQLLAGVDAAKVGPPANAPASGPKYTKVKRTQVSEGDRQIIKNDLLGSDGVLGWLDKKLGTNMAAGAKKIYEDDNAISSFVRDRDMTRREAADAYDDLRQDVSDAAAWTQHRLDNMDMADAGWNGLRMVGGALQAWAGAALVGKGAALTGTGIGAILGVPMMAVGGFMVVNGAADVAAGATNIYKNFMGDKDRIGGNMEEIYKATTGATAEEVPTWVKVADVGAGMVGSFTGMARGGINALRGAGTFGRALFTGGLRGSKAIAGAVKGGMTSIANLGNRVRQGVQNMAGRAQETLRKPFSAWGNRPPDIISETPRNTGMEARMLDELVNARNVVDSPTGILRKIQRGLGMDALSAPHARALPEGVGGYLDDATPVINSKLSFMERMGVAVHEYRHVFDKINDVLYNNSAAYRMNAEIRAALDQRAFLMKNLGSTSSKNINGAGQNFINKFADDIYRTYAPELADALNESQKMGTVLSIARQMGIRPKRDLMFRIFQN